MTSEGFLDVNHCPKQTTIPNRKDEGSPQSQMQQQQQFNWQAENALPHSSVFQHGSGLLPQMPASQFHPSNTNMFQHGSGLLPQMPASQFDPSGSRSRSRSRRPPASGSRSGRRPDKRKQTSNSKSSEDEKTNLMYTCKFCGKCFSMSQALGGHMNMHRIEKEDEEYKEALHIVKTRGNDQPSSLQIPHSSLVDFISRVPSSVPYDITRMQTHQQRNFYHAASLNNPYSLDQYINEYSTFATNQSQPPYERRNQDTMLGIPYERNHVFPSNPTNTSGLLPPVGAQGMHPNYLPQQARESTSVVLESHFNPGFQSLVSYPMQSEVFGAESLGQASQQQQFNLHDSVPSSFHSPGIGQSTMEGEIAQERETTGSINIHGAGSSSLSPEIDNKYNQYFPQVSSEFADIARKYDQQFSQDP